MHESEHEKLCDMCLVYISGECTPGEKLAFERHLAHCSGCREEVRNLRDIWEVLSVDMERIEPPKDLKKQVLDGVFSADQEGKVTSRQSKFLNTSWKRFGAAAAILLVAISGTLWNYRLFTERANAPLPIEQALSVPAAQIEQLITLKPVSPEEEYTYGVACIVNNGQSKQFIVYVFGAAQTKQQEAYQVWLIRGNERTSAGTFRVNEEGVGVLAMPIASDELEFDALGITLEPDDQGDRPRGPKMFASL